MKNIREIVSQNITNLRKNNGLTQVELAKKINFSDKAISRWEKGEVMPDVETIQKLSEVFNVSVSAILENQECVNEQKVNSVRQEILSQIFLICEIWIIIPVIYAYLNISKGLNVWQIFVWGIPTTALFLMFQNRKKEKNVLKFVYGTLFVWSFITCLFLQMLASQPWYFFLLGVPIQGVLIVRYLFNYKRKKVIKIKRKNR